MSQFIVNLILISVACGVLVLGLWGLSPLLNRHFKARWKYWLWLIIAVRLLLPVNFVLPQFVGEVGNFEVMVVRDVPVFAPGDSPQVRGTVPFQAALSQITIYQALFVLWLVGFITFITMQALRYRKIRRSIIRWGVVPQNPHLIEVIEGKTNIPTLIYNNIQSPMIMGIFRPILVLPREDYNPADLNLILRHELTHHKNKDILYKILLLVVNAAHWFNPAIYIMLREAHADLERVCDDAVTANSDSDERRAYSEVILSSITASKNAGGVALTTLFYSGTRNIKARFSNIMDKGKGRGGAAWLGLAVVAMVIMSGFSIPVVGHGGSARPVAATGEVYHFINIAFDRPRINNLVITLEDCDVLIIDSANVIDFWDIPATQVHFGSAPAFAHALRLDPATRTAYITKSANPIEQTHEGVVPAIMLIIPADGGWVFDHVSIHLVNGNIRVHGPYFEEFLAADFNITLENGAIIHYLLQEEIWHD